MSSRFNHVGCVRNTFLLKAEQFSSVWIERLLSVPPLTGTGLLLPLAPVNDIAVNMGIQIFKTLLSVLLGMYSEVKLLHHIVILLLIFLRNSHSVIFTSLKLTFSSQEFCIKSM